jgi:hypothetical protein
MASNLYDDYSRNDLENALSDAVGRYNRCAKARDRSGVKAAAAEVEEIRAELVRR